MSESIKDRFLKEHALSDEELENVNGGGMTILFGEVYDGKCKTNATISSGYCIASGICEMKDCKYHN